MEISRQLYQLEEYIRIGRIEEVWMPLRKLCEAVPEFQQEKNDLLLIESGYRSLEQELQQGLLYRSEGETDKNKKRKQLIDFLTMLKAQSPDREAWAVEEQRLRRKKADQMRALGFEPKYQETELDRMIHRLNLEEEVGLLELVNCNRTEEQEHFWEAYDQQDNEAFQFYFLPACSRQQPNSFSERMIYELIEDELDGLRQAISYEQNRRSSRLKSTQFPLGRNLKKSKGKLTDYFNERFGMDAADIHSFLQAGTPPYRYEAVATVFYMEEEGWKERLMPDYLRWMIQRFGQAKTDARTRFYFFFVVYLPGVHERQSSKANKILGQIQSVVDQHACCTVINPLKAVKQRDMYSWLRQLGARNQQQMEAILRVYVQSLEREKSRKQYDTTQTLDMTDIEAFQEQVYQIQNQFSDHANSDL